MNEQMMILMIFQFRLGKKFFDKKNINKNYKTNFFSLSLTIGALGPPKSNMASLAELLSTQMSNPLTTELY